MSESAGRPLANTPASDAAGGGNPPASSPAGTGNKAAANADPMDRAVVNGGQIPYRRRMEEAFGADFGSVRATVGASSALGEMGAIGAARGEEIAFASPSPDPAVVAHELTHVVQRRRHAGGASTEIEDEGSSAEQEAEHVGELVAAGGKAPPITQVPTGRVARAIPRELLRKGPPAPAQVGAGEWLDHMLLMSPLRPHVAAQLIGAQLPLVHPRLTWNLAGALLQRVWTSVNNAARLQLVVAPFDILARIDLMRELSEQKAKVNVGPLTYVPEVATIIARQIETAVAQCVQRLGPRLVAAYDASTDPWAGKPAARDAGTLPPNSIVASHPLDRVVEGLVREGGVATILPRVATENEPSPDRTVPGALRVVTYRWADDPALWNWIRTEPADATPEEVAKQVLGTTARAYEIQGSAPFFALPPSHVKMIAPERSTPAALKVGEAMNKPGFVDAAEELQHGVPERALARSKVGEQAALAQAEHAGAHATAAKGDNDTADLAARCQSQVHLISDSYPQLGAQRKLAAMAARLAGRIQRLQTMSAADHERFGRLFAEQSSVLYAVAGDLQTLDMQAKKLQRSSGPAAPIDPTIAEITTLVLEAGASSDLPETARKQLQVAHARHASMPFDAMEAMLDDARAQTMATDSLAEKWGPGDSGSTKASAPMTGREQWQDLRSRETQLSGDVLAARRAHDVGTEKAGSTRTLAERTRALQVEARVVAAETQCAYMGDKLQEQEGIVATAARQMSDLQGARNGLRALSNTMAGIRIRWREKHAQLFALVEPGGQTETDPAIAIRHAIAELEAELAQVGDDKTRSALQTAQSELKDMAVARAVADIALMIGLTLVTGALGSAAGGAARGLGMGRGAAQLVNVGTQSLAMATLRTVLSHDSFASAFGSELLTNFAGLAALRGVAAGLSKLKLGKALTALKDGGGAWKYVAHGAELTIELATQSGIMFAVAEAESLAREGRTLNDDELKMIAIQGIGMFIGNAIAHRLTSPAIDAIAAYAAKVGAPYRRTKVLNLVERVKNTKDPEAASALLREERALVAEELALLQQIARDPAERVQFGDKTLATVTDQAQHHAGELTRLGAERALQSGLAEIDPGRAWEGTTNQVEHALTEAHAAGATIREEPLPDGTRRHIVTAGAQNFIVYERGSPGGKETGGKETGGKETGGKETGGKETGGKETGGKEIGGKETGGKETGGKETGGKETGGKETGGLSEVPGAVLGAVKARVQSRQLVDIFRAGGAAAVQDVYAAIKLETSGRLRGLSDWIAFADGKAPVDLRRTLGELSEAQRLAAANPRSVINIGGDRRAPRRVSDPTAAMPTFDITVEAADGSIGRSVEVTTIDAPVSQVGDVTSGVRHAVDKVEGRARPPDARDAQPIPGDHDVTIRMTLAAGDASLRGGRVRRIAPDGEVRIIDADGQFRARPDNPTNLYDDVATNLAAISNNENLSRVILVDQSSHAVLATYERVGTVWTRVP